jgi:hypothetical protein
MGLIPLGILSSAGGSLGAYELIQSTILGSSTSSVVFSGLDSYAGIYKHLQVRLVGRNSNAATSSSINIRFNSDAGANYALHAIYGNGSSVLSFGVTGRNEGYVAEVTGASIGANIFGAAVIDILDTYSTSKNKTIRSLNGATSYNNIALFSGLWLNTAALTSITLLAQSGANFVTGSRFSLYGIR